MKALSVLIALQVCLSGGVQWTRYPDIYSKLNYNYLHRDVDNSWKQNNSPYPIVKRNDGAYSPFFLPPNLKLNWYNAINAQVTANKLSYSGSQHLDAKAKRTEDKGGVQKKLSFNRRELGDDLDIKPDVKKYNNYVYFLNKTSSSPATRQSFTSIQSEILPNQPNLLESNPGSRYLLNENNQKYKESYWLQPRPSWNQQLRPFPPNPFINSNADGLYPVINNNNEWNQVEQNQNDCSDLIDIIRDLRLLLRTNNINEAKYGLKSLIRILQIFIVNNNLQYASFNVIVREIGKVLLNGIDDHNSLREENVVEVLQEFKYRDLNNFLSEIRFSREKSLQSVVSKLALLLYRLKQNLIQRRYSQESIRIVINRAVQLAVPLVGYYFEKECKIKTQKYIVKNLEVALNVNLESVQNVQNIDELQTELNLDGWGNQDALGNLEGNLGNGGNLGGLGNLVNPGWLGNQGSLGGIGGGAENLGGLGELGNQGNLEGLGDLGNQESLGGLGGGVGNLVGLGNLGNQGSRGLGGGVGNLGGLGPLDLGNPGSLGLGGVGNQDLGSLGTQGVLVGVGGLENQGNLGGLADPGILGGRGNQVYPGNPGSLGGVGKLINPLK